MTRTELIRATAAKTGVTIKDTKVMVDALLDVITETLVAGENVEVTGFGTYSTVTKDAHIARNPRTGETVEVAAKRRPKFKYSSKIATALNA